MSTSTQISRILGKESRKTNQAENDHISNLPNCIISRILSRLPMHEAVKTSVLSKDWEYKWTSRYEILLFDFLCCNGSRKANFVNFVERTLLLPQNFQSLKLSCVGKYDKCRIKRWISAALSRDVHYLRIDFRYASIILPINLLNRYSLKRLELDMPCTFKVSAEFCFPYLTTLKLENIKFFNELSNSDPVKFNFPVLETLMLMSCEWSNVKFVEIYAPKLTSFRSRAPWGSEVNDYSIKIVGDSLVKFESSGVVAENIILCGGSEVVYADFKNGWAGSGLQLRVIELSGLQIRKLLKELPSLKELELSEFAGKAIALSGLRVPLPKFYTMERLVLSYAIGNTEALLELLHATPFLKILDLKLRGWKDHDYDAEEYVPSCILSHLEIVKFTCCAGTMHQLLKLAKFFLKNAVRLKNICFSVWSNPCPQILKNEITQELSTFPKASTTLTIGFTWKM